MFTELMGSGSGDVNLKDFTYKYWSSHSSTESVNLGFKPKKVIFSFYFSTIQYFRVYDEDDSTTNVHTYTNGTDRGETLLSSVEFALTDNGITIKSGAISYLQVFAYG